MNVKRLEGHGFHLYQDTRVKIHSERYVTVRIVYVVVRNVATMSYIVTKRLEHVHGMGSLRMRMRANHVQVVPTVLSVHPVALATLPCTRNERVAIVATVLVRVKLPRRPRVERGRRRWVGGIRRRILGQFRLILPGVIIIIRP